MSAPILVTFARPEESGAFRKRIASLQRCETAGLPAWRGFSAGAPVVVLHSGIGPASAKRVIDAALSAGRPARVIGAGFGGGLDPSLRIGDTLVVHWPSTAILSLEHPLETVAEKAAAFAKCGARVVDMETATLATACDSAGIPFTGIRAVSDSATDPLAVPFEAWFDARHQRPRPLALLGFLALHPSRVIPFARFVLGLPRVANALALAVEAEISASR